MKHDTYPLFHVFQGMNAGIFYVYVGQYDPNLKGDLPVYALNRRMFIKIETAVAMSYLRRHKLNAEEVAEEGWLWELFLAQ